MGQPHHITAGVTSHLQSGVTHTIWWNHIAIGVTNLVGNSHHIAAGVTSHWLFGKTIPPSHTASVTSHWVCDRALQFIFLYYNNLQVYSISITLRVPPAYIIECQCQQKARMDTEILNTPQNATVNVVNQLFQVCHP